MLRAYKVLPAGGWDPLLCVATVSLAYEQRRQRCAALTADDGTRFLLDLSRAACLRDGDGLPLDSIGIVEVRAAPERLLELRCADSATLVRLAWHLGNRDVPAMPAPGAVRIRADHVLADLAQRLGAQVLVLDAPFDPDPDLLPEMGGRQRETQAMSDDHLQRHIAEGGGRVVAFPRGHRRRQP